jgi:hypothetical protein
MLTTDFFFEEASKKVAKEQPLSGRGFISRRLSEKWP